MNEIELKKLWDKLQGKINVGDFERFKSLMSDVESRKRFYDKFYNKLKNLRFDLKSYAEFERRLSSGNNGGGNTGGGGSVSQGWLSDPTGNQTWEYQVRDCKWVARKKGQTTEYVISDNPKYQSSVDILNNSYPNLIKDCNKSSTQQTPTKPDDKTDGETQTPSVIFPDWVSCLKTLPTGVKMTTDTQGNSVVIYKFAGNNDCYFWQDGTALYNDSKTGEKMKGKWSCINGQLLIKFDDWGPNGWQWSLSTGWMEQPSATQNPDENFGTSWTSPEQLTSPTQNESFMSDLENVITEINNLVNEELVVEQRVDIVQAPKDELNILRTNPMLKATGTLEALCRTNNGTSKPVNVNNKIYFAGKKITLKTTGQTTGQTAYLTYDGMVLQRQGNSCNFTYVKDQNGLMHIKGIPYSDLDLQYTDILRKFGIDPKNYDTDPYFLINSISTDLQNLAKQGAVSSVFKSWNDMLTYYHPNDYNDYALVPLSPASGGTGSLNPPTNRGELSQYRVINGRNYGLNYNDKDVVIYVPATAGPITSGGGKKQYNETACKTAIVEYLSAAIRFETDQDPSSNPTINNSDNRTFIKGCYGANAYSGLTISETDLPTVSKDSRIFKWFRGKTLSIKEVSYLLSGKDKNLPSGKNPYLPFPLRKADMNESKTKLTNIIKENLSKLSEEKQNNLLAETRIIQTRTKLLMENRILKFKQPREKFFNEIISEAIYLESQGFDKQLIKEEFWDTIKGLFGQHGSEAIFGTFKEYMGKWLLQKLTPVNPEGWIGSVIVAAIGNLHFDDISKLTDCDFITKKVAESIGEGIARKLQHDKGYNGGISDVVRNGLFSAINNTELVRNLETGLSKFICPALGGVTKKLENKADQMKLNAVKP